MSIWVMVFIAGLLCTQITNPFFWFRFARGTKEYFQDMRKFRSNHGKGIKPKYRQYLAYGEIGSITMAIVGNIICFVVGSIILWALYYFTTSDRTFSMILASGWFIAILNCISTYLTFADARAFKTVEYLQAWALSIAMVLISLVLLIHGGLYDFHKHKDANTFLHETEVPVISMDVSNTLKNTVLIQGYSLHSAINRNGKIIFPLSRNNNISIVGYVELTEDGTPIIIKKELHYTPYQTGSQNVKYVARDYLPTKQFFGNWSFQLSPDGEVYFAIAYGDFASLRGGRLVTGILIINATTGECETYPLDEVPNWVTGISE